MVHGYCTTSINGLNIGKINVRLVQSEKDFSDNAFTPSTQGPYLGDI